MIILSETGQGYKTLPGTDYSAFDAMIKGMRDRGLSVEVFDEAGAKYFKLV